MAAADHRALLDVLRQCKGKVVLSGYPSPLYDRSLANWNRHAFDLPNNAANGKEKQRETEVMWCNFYTDQQDSREQDGSRQAGAVRQFRSP